VTTLLDKAGTNRGEVAVAASELACVTERLGYETRRLSPRICEIL
jgi:hypothetical protein